MKNLNNILFSVAFVCAVMWAILWYVSSLKEDEDPQKKGILIASWVFFAAAVFICLGVIVFGK